MYGKTQHVTLLCMLQFIYFLSMKLSSLGWVHMKQLCLANFFFPKPKTPDKRVVDFVHLSSVYIWTEKCCMQCFSVWLKQTSGYTTNSTKRVHVFVLCKGNQGRRYAKPMVSMSFKVIKIEHQ